MMMKRVTAVLMALLMLCQCAFAMEEYTLSEKIGLQMNDGSGLKGSFTLTAEGDAEWAKSIAAVAGHDFQIRCIRSGSGYLCEIYAAKGEEKQALTTIWFDEGGSMMSSALLPDTTLQLPVGAEALDMLVGKADNANPTWYTVALNLLGADDDEWTAQWEEAIAPYHTTIEVWMNSYSAAPVITEEDGRTVMILRYEIPGKAVKDMMISILQTVLNDQALVTLLGGQMTPEQQALYLSPDLLYHYENIIRAVPLEGSVIIERKLTTMGEVLYSSVTLPVAISGVDMREISMVEELGAYQVTMATDEGDTVISVTAPVETDAGDKRTLSYRYIPASLGEESKAVSWQADVISSYEKRTDDDTRSHEITSVEMTVKEDLSHLSADAPERAFYEKIDEQTITFKLHLHSKNANTSPTTAALDVTYASGGSSAAFSGQIKTTSPWVPGVFGSEANAVLADMTDEEVSTMLAAFMVNAIEMLGSK